MQDWIRIPANTRPLIWHITTFLDGWSGWAILLSWMSEKQRQQLMIPKMTCANRMRWKIDEQDPIRVNWVFLSFVLSSFSFEWTDNSIHRASLIWHRLESHMRVAQRQKTDRQSVPAIEEIIASSSRMSKCANVGIPWIWIIWIRTYNMR